jgi:hypothetical protein
MKVEKFTDEVVKIGDAFLALSTIHSISPVYLNGIRGYGSVWYSFDVQSALGGSIGTKIGGEAIEYWELPSETFRQIDQEEHEMFINKKIELLVVRDELVQLWCEYLENNK